MTPATVSGSLLQLGDGRIYLAVRADVALEQVAFGRHRSAARRDGELVSQFPSTGRSGTVAFGLAELKRGAGFMAAS